MSDYSRSYPCEPARVPPRYEGGHEGLWSRVRTESLLIQRFHAIKVALLYGMPSAVYILTSDALVNAIAPTPDWANRMQSMKGLVFVLATTLLIYGVSRLHQSRIEKDKQKAAAILRKSETQHHDVLENLGDPIVTFDEFGNILAFNEKACRIFGYSEAEIVGKHIGCLVPDPFRSQHDTLLQQYRTTGRYQITNAGPREICGVKRNGAEFPVEVSVGLLDRSDSTTFIGFFRDLTAKKETERQLSHAMKMEAIGRLTGGVAHDFNNALQAISGSLSQLKHNLGEGRFDATSEPLIVASKACSRASDLTKGLLAFARKQVLHPSTCDLNNIVQETTLLIDRLAGDDIEIVIRPSSNLWYCEIDPSQAQSALLNLCVNARDAMPQGGTITLETRNQVLEGDPTNLSFKPGAYVAISVSDTGCGIPKEIIDKVFEPFFTTKGVGKGTGLGLSMVIGFVQQSKGTLKLDSKEGEGTTFTLYFPRSQQQKPKPRNFLPRASDELPRGSESILLIEDDPLVARTMEVLLVRLGYKVSIAKTGQEALAKAESEATVDLIISDFVLPGALRGPAIVERIVEDHGGAAILFISGYLDHGIEEESKLVRDDNFLGKPFSDHALAQAVRQQIDRKRNSL